MQEYAGVLVGTAFHDTGFSVQKNNKYKNYLPGCSATVILCGVCAEESEASHHSSFGNSTELIEVSGFPSIH